MNCIVTGGAGFIGSHLVDRLIELNHKVIVIDNESANENIKFYWNSKAENYKYDICDYENISKLFENIDWVFHFAARSRIQPSIIDPTETIKVNCQGTENILHACKENNIKKIIFSSSSSIYGLKNKVPHEETMSRDCLNPYSISKVMCEDLCKVYYELYNLEVIILRYFNVFGERQPTKGEYAPIIGRFLKLKKINKKLTVVGDGMQKRDYTYVKDVVYANILAAKKNNIGNCEIINIGSGKNYSVLDIAEIIDFPFEHIPERKGEAYETLASIEKAKKILNWYPSISLKEWMQNKG